LSFSIGFDEGRLSRIIRGYEKPTPEVQEAIADFFGVPEDELFLKPREPIDMGKLEAQHGQTHRDDREKRDAPDGL